VTDTGVTILNRNNSADRLEAVTDIAPDSPLVQGLAHAEPRSCLAVRSARVHEQDDRRPPLLGCSVCSACPGASTCAPLTVGGEVIGSVLVNRADRYSQRERSQIRDAVAQSAPVLANLRNLAIAELRASTDSLTGLPNKRAVGDTLQRMLAQAARSLSPLSLLVLDLDHFKTINDRLGHPIGDQVLANVGAALRSTMRDGDFAGRNGGEEFILLLPDTDLMGALTAAEKVRVAIEEIAIPGLEVSPTASIGIAVYPEHAVNPDRLERLADAALYVAKKSGRNRIEVASPASEASRADLDDETRWPHAVT
jgi:diguanylate cyclase (GGDEF)-like protein